MKKQNNSVGFALKSAKLVEMNVRNMMMTIVANVQKHVNVAQRNAKKWLLNKVFTAENRKARSFAETYPDLTGLKNIPTIY